MKELLLWMTGESSLVGWGPKRILWNIFDPYKNDPYEMLYIWNRLVFDFVNVHAPIIWKRIKSCQSSDTLEATKNCDDVKKVLDRWITSRDTNS